MKNLHYISEVHQEQEQFIESSPKSKVKLEMYLTTKETIYAIATSLAALTVLLSIIIFWGYQQPNCWDLHATEEQAIVNCEK